MTDKTQDDTAQELLDEATKRAETAEAALAAETARADKAEQALADHKTTATPAGKPKPKKSAQPKAYKAPHQVYTGGKLYEPGDVFVTAEPKGDAWEPVDSAEKAATDAADPQRRDDVNLDELDVSALKGHAASLGVDLGGAKSKADIITVIKARNDPTR